MNEVSPSDAEVKIIGEEVFVEVAGGGRFKVESATVTSRKRFSYLYLVAGFVLLVFGVAYVIFFLIGGAILLVYFLLNPTIYRLEAYGPEGKLVVEGKRGEVKDLHYDITVSLGKAGKLKREKTEETPRDSDERLGRVRADEILDEKGVERLKEEFEGRLIKKGKKRIVSLQCPQCGGRELYYEGAFFFGGVYHCKDCDYVGPFVIEKEIIVED